MHVVQLPRRFVRHSWGGTETVVLETSSRLPQYGVSTEVMTFSALSEPGEEDFNGVQVKRYPYFYPYWGLTEENRRRMDDLGGSMFSFSLMRALHRIPQVDLIHLHTQKRPGAIGRYVARKRGIPYVVSLHGGLLDMPVESKQALLEPTRNTWEWGKVLGWWVGSRRVLEDAAAIVCVGLPEQRAVQTRYPNHRVEYLPNGVSLARFAKGNGAAFRSSIGIPSAARVLLTVARIDPQKNQRLALEALAALRAQDSRFHWVFIGPVTNQRYFDELLRLIDELSLRGVAHFLGGFLPDDPRLVDAYHAADLFVLPSIHEPFGIVILEAWAASKPVLASRIGGIPYFVEDGRDGYLFEPGSRSELVRACLQLERSQLSLSAHEGRKKVLREYTWDRITSRLSTLYEEVVG